MTKMSKSRPSVNFRKAITSDLARIVKIHNDIILEGGLTADLDPHTVEEKRMWFEEVSQRPYCLQLLEVDEVVAGYVYLSPWRNGRASLGRVSEISYFLEKKFRGRGYGRKLLRAGMLSASQNEFKTLLAILLDSNVRSVSLLESEGFYVAGHLPQVAELNELIVGQFIMMKKIG